MTSDAIPQPQPSSLKESSAPTGLFQRNRLLTMAFLVLAGVIVLERYSKLDFSLGVFYVFPILLAATVVNRWQILIAALVCALVRSYVSPELPALDFWLRFETSILAYGGIGFLVVEMNRHRRSLLAAYAHLKLEKEMRFRAEDQFRTLAESSPAAIITLNNRAEVLAANRAASEILGFTTPTSMIGKSVAEYVPLFSGALRVAPGVRSVRTSASSWAKRTDGALFPVATWFSTYGEGEERCLAGILVDTSEEVRERERENFRHFVGYNRLVAGAVSHEIRNMCSAIRVVTTNLRQKPEVAENTDFIALTTLVNSLASIASFDLRNSKDDASSWINLNTVLEQLRVVIETDWSEIEGVIRWDLEYPSPMISADSHALLQVFLNLSQNSLRAAQPHSTPTLDIQTRTVKNTAVISIVDSGSGISDPSELFQPFRADADGSGLGLYISRTLVRSFGGELTFVPTKTGCRFDVILPAALD